MEVTEHHNQLRPSLQPLWAGYDGLPRLPRSSFRVQSPGFSPSSRSPRHLPSPLHPRASSAQESAMRRHERAMVDSLDQGAKATTPSSVASLSPIIEQSPGFGSRRPTISLGATTSSQVPSFPPPSPESGGQAAGQLPRRPTIASETRNILLAGLPQIQARSVGASVERRPSLPAISVPPLTPPSASRRSSATIRERLEAWGSVYLGDAKYADCFVAAVSLSPRRASDASPSSDKAPRSRPEGNPRDSADPNRVTIRARVKPRAIERKPFLLQRTFNMDELRATIPAPSPAPATFRRPSLGIEALTPRSSASVDLQSPSLTSSRRFSNGSGGQTPKSTFSPSSLSRPFPRGPSAVPIHLKYARVHLPVLAALMMSGHVHEGDVIYLPTPHPEAWSQTVARVYTGRGELTDAIRENILYLAGRV